MDTATTLKIPESNMPRLRAGIEKLAKRAERLGITPPTLKVGAFEDVELRDEARNATYIRRFYAVTVAQAAPVVVDGGWSFVATIDHGRDEDGENINVVRQHPGSMLALPKSYRTDAPTCDHCHVNRSRNETFVIASEADVQMRVGRQCLRNYLGDKSAAQLLQEAAFLRELDILCRDSEECDGFGRGVWRIPMTVALTWAAVATRLFGWTSRGSIYRGEKEGPATADSAWACMTLHMGLRRPGRGETLPKIEDADRDLAERALAWARDIDPDTDSDYLHNLRTVCSQSSLTEKEIGIAASAVMAYQRHQEREALRKAQNATESSYLGEVGKRFGGKGKNALPVLTGTVIRRNSFDGMYGTTTVVTMQVEGNDVVWFSSASVSSDIAPGALVQITGTVKRHAPDKRSQRKTTYISRASLACVA